MGQYYKPCILEDLKKGSKVEKIKGWFYSWDFGSGLKLMEHSLLKNGMVKTFESIIEDNPMRVVWAGDYADNEEHLPKNSEQTNLYDIASEKYEGKQLKPKESKTYFRYVINHSKKTFVDKFKVPNVDGWRIHPLPLLTAEGNGRGGGDFIGESELVGSWSRDSISTSKRKPKEYTELIFDLKESW